MAFSYSAALQGRIALAVWNVQNSSLTATQKVQLDNTWTSGALSGGAAYDAWNEVAQLAQYFEQASSAPDTSYQQPAWDRLFIAKTAMYLMKTVRPERYNEFKADYETALDESIDTFTRDLVSSTSAAGQGVGLAGIRAFTIDHCVKRADSSTGLRRRLFPSIAQIDGHIQWTLNFLWNLKPWHFRKRQVTIRTTMVSVTGATWTESTKTLTATGLFTNTNIGAGSRFLVTDGTGALTGEYVISSRTSDNAIVLDTSMSSAGVNLTTGDITGTVQIVTVHGMHSGETFDAVMSRKLYYDGTNLGCEVEWRDSSDLARSKAAYGDDDGMPRFFRWEKYSTGQTWHFSPFPDDDYTMRGAVSVTGPGTLSTSATIDTAIARFPTEFGTVIRDIVLARTLKGFRASDGEAMWQTAMDQVDALLPQYADQGFPTRQTSTDDVYNDHAALNQGQWVW